LLFATSPVTRAVSPTMPEAPLSLATTSSARSRSTANPVVMMKALSRLVRQAKPGEGERDVD
jgi:hypothetical protein